MIAAQISPNLRTVVMGSPVYCSRARRLETPQDLQKHGCIAMRLPTHGRFLGWEFAQGNRTIVSHVTGSLVFNQPDLIISAAFAGHGLAWLAEDFVRSHLDRPLRHDA